MRLLKRLIGIALASGATAAAFAGPINTTPELEYSQDGVTFQPFDVMVGRQKVRNYYDYYGQSGHPAFGTKRDTASAAVYWDAKRKALSLIVINGAARHGFRTAQQEARYAFSGLPASGYMSMKDDPDDIDYKRGKPTATAHFVYKSSTDGLVISGLEQLPFTVKMTLTGVKNVDHWRLADGTVHSAADFLTLDEAKPVFIRMASVGATPTDPDPANGGSGGTGGTGGTVGGNPGVPEPASALTAVLGLGTVVLGSRRRRRR
jgi:hypothetical protein